MSDETFDIKIRSRRSKKPDNKRMLPRNPVTEHTIDDDLPYIRKYAEMYKSINPSEQELLNKFVFDNKSIEYYYGSYVTTYQMFVMAHSSNNELSIALMSLLHAISFKIVETIDGKK